MMEHSTVAVYFRQSKSLSTSREKNPMIYHHAPRTRIDSCVASAIRALI